MEYVGSHRESDNPLRVQARSRGGWWSTWALIESRTILCGSRRDQEEGGGVPWALIESRTILCGSRRDQEEGGGVPGLS